MDRASLLQKMRQHLGDATGSIWQDAELLRMLDEAARVYSGDAGCFHGFFDFCPDEDLIYRYPEDYLYFCCGWNRDSVHISAMCSHDLERYYGDPLNVRGLPTLLFDDLSNDREYRLCPDPLELQDIVICVFSGGYEEYISDPSKYGTIVSEIPVEQDLFFGVCEDVYGVVFPGDAFGVLSEAAEYEFSGDYGLFLDNAYGILDYEKYGIVTNLMRYEYVGDVMYTRTASVEEIADHTALLYYGLYLAFDTDSEFCNRERANAYKEQYLLRVGMFNQIKHKNSGLHVTGNFY